MKTLLNKIMNWWRWLRLGRYQRKIAKLVQSNHIMSLRNMYKEKEITFDELTDCYRVVAQRNPSEKTIRHITEMINSVRQ